MTIKCLIIIIFFMLISGVERVCASTQMMSAHIAFDAVLSISDETGIDFGSLKANQAGTYTVSPSGVVTATNSGVVLGGTSNAGSMTIAGSTTQAIDVSTSNYVASNGVTPMDATCSYDGGAPSLCSLTSQTPPGGGKILLVGVTVDVDGNQNINTTASPTFDVVVNYH